MSKKTKPKYNGYRNNDDSMWDDDRLRYRVKTHRQNKDAKHIERALKRKDYKALAEEYM